MDPGSTAWLPNLNVNWDTILKYYHIQIQNVFMYDVDKKRCILV